VAQLVEALCYKPEGCGSDSAGGHWTQFFRSHSAPGIDSAYNRDEYQGYRILCIVDRASLYMRVMKRSDALFIFILFSHYTSTYFGHASGSSSGGNNVYMRQLVRVVGLSLLSAGLVGMEQRSPTVD
jgi:hypothetical protein